MDRRENDQKSIKNRENRTDIGAMSVDKTPPSVGDTPLVTLNGPLIPIFGATFGTSGWRLPIFGATFGTSGWRLPISGVTFGTSGWGLPISGATSGTSGWGLPIFGVTSGTSGWGLPIFGATSGMPGWGLPIFGVTTLRNPRAAGKAGQSDDQTGSSASPNPL